MSASGACNLLCTAAALLSRLCPAVTGFSFTAVFNLTVNSTELSEELLNSSKDKKKSKITAEQTHGWRGRKRERARELTRIISFKRRKHSSAVLVTQKKICIKKICMFWEHKTVNI